MLKDAVPLREVARALVIQLRHHGDVLLASPVLGALKSHAPAAEVDALVYDDTAPMIEGHPAIARLHCVGRRWRTQPWLERLALEARLFRTLRERRYDLLVHLTEQPRGAWLARGLGPRYSVAPAAPDRGPFWRKSFTHVFPTVRNGRRHRVEANLDALRRIGVQPSSGERAVRFVPGAEAEEKVTGLLAADGMAGAPFNHLHPASRWKFKRWTPQANAELLDKFSSHHRVVLTAAPDPAERSLVDDILKRTRAQVVDLSGRLGLKELGALTARARLFVGVDSMPMHLAAAMGTPVVALFGPSGEAEWAPWRTAHRIVASTRHACRPCGNDGCGGGKVSECLTTLGVDEVYAAAQGLLAPARPGA